VAERVRPTLRCLREDLGLAVPLVDVPLEELAHPLLAKAGERFVGEQALRERIAAVEDQVLFKVKVQRWRGAVWVDAGVAWLVAAGQREEGSPDDFYAALAARGKAARARYNAEHTPPLAGATYTGDLLPAREDELRWRAEAAARAERQLRVSCAAWSGRRCSTGASTPQCSTARHWASRFSPIRATKPTSRSASSDQSRVGSSRRSSASSPAARPTPGCPTTPCRNGQWPPKSRSGPTSWTPPLPRRRAQCGFFACRAVARAASLFAYRAMYIA